MDHARPDDRSRKPDPAAQDQTYPESMAEERSQPDEKMTLDKRSDAHHDRAPAADLAATSTGFVL